MADACLAVEKAVAPRGPGMDRRPLATQYRTALQAGIRTPVPDSPLPEKSTRRRFTAEYKLRILLEADQFTKPGELGDLLRREGLYSSHLCAWRRQRDAGAMAALTPKKRGRKPATDGAVVDENRWLHRENRHLQARLRQAEMIIAMQTKVSDVLGIPLADTHELPGRPDAPQTDVL